MTCPKPVCKLQFCTPFPHAWLQHAWEALCDPAPGFALQAFKFFRCRVQAEVLHRLCAVPGRRWCDPACVLAVPDRSPSCMPPTPCMISRATSCSRPLLSDTRFGVALARIKTWMNSWRPHFPTSPGAPARHQVLGACPALSCLRCGHTTLPACPGCSVPYVVWGHRPLHHRRLRHQTYLLPVSSTPWTSSKQGQPAPDGATGAGGA